MILKEITTAHRLLANRAFDIEFNGYLSNHAKHAIVALDRLDASAERIQEWWDDYTTITPYSLPLHPVSQSWEKVTPATKEQWQEWRGKKVGWQEMCVHLQQELEDRFQGNTDDLVKEYAPSLIPGMAGALTHGMIHLGWGIDAASPWMTIEGLAYTNFAFLGVDPSLISVEEVGNETPLDTMIHVASEFDDKNLQETWIEQTKAKYDETYHPELVAAGFQWHLAKTLEHPHPIATKTPSWLRDTPIKDLWEQLYRTVTYIYLATKDHHDGHGNFLILHGLTSLWGLEHVLNVLDNEATTRKALQQYYAVLVTLLATSSSGFPAASLLHHAASHIPFDEVEEPDWDPIVAAGINEEEEHNIKLVYVSRELWKRYGKWKGFVEAARSFTLTPNIGSSAVAFKA